MLNIRMTGDWDKANKTLDKVQKQFKDVINGILMREAEVLRGIIITGFEAQAPGGKPFQPLSAWTIAMRRFRGFGGSKALIYSGEMRKSIVAKNYPSTMTAFVGILYQTRRSGDDGERMVNIAKVHEFGSKPFVVDVTPAMRRLLAAVAKTTGLIQYTEGRKGVERYLIKIPARPFLRPSYEKWRVGLEDRIQAQLKRGLGL